MNMEREILRHNDRNISYKEFHVDKYVFTKTSASSDTNPAEEYCFWEYFYKLNSGMIPLCIQSLPQSKTIQYEWLEGYEQISGKYSPQNLEMILAFLDLNASTNTFDKLKNDINLNLLSEKKLQQQLGYYSNIRESAITFYCDFVSKTIFEKSFDLSIEDFCYKDVLCHGDLGKSNILIKDADIKIIDFEYAMFSAKELDYGRLLSSIFLAYQNKEIDKQQFFEMVLMIAKSPVKLDTLARLAGLQLTMRIIHTYGNKEKLPRDAYNHVRTALNLLSAKDVFCTNQDFLNLFII